MAEKLRRLRGGKIRSIEKNKVVEPEGTTKIVLTEEDTIYAEKTRAELLELCKEQGITGATRLNKSEIIQKLMQVE